MACSGPASIAFLSSLMEQTRVQVVMERFGHLLEEEAPTTAAGMDAALSVMRRAYMWCFDMFVSDDEIDGLRDALHQVVAQWMDDRPWAVRDLVSFWARLQVGDRKPPWAVDDTRDRAFPGLGPEVEWFVREFAIAANLRPTLPCGEGLHLISENLWTGDFEVDTYEPQTAAAILLDWALAHTAGPSALVNMCASVLPDNPGAEEVPRSLLAHRNVGACLARALCRVQRQGHGLHEGVSERFADTLARGLRRQMRAAVAYLGGRNVRSLQKTVARLDHALVGLAPFVDQCLDETISFMLSWPTDLPNPGHVAVFTVEQAVRARWSPLRAAWCAAVSCACNDLSLALRS